MRSGFGRWAMLGAVCASWVFTLGMGAKPPSLNIPAFSAEVENDLPKGSSVGDVVKFLDAHDLKHSALISPQHVIYAIVQVKKSADPSTSPARAELQFWFSPDGRFIHFVVRDYDPSLN